MTKLLLEVKEISKTYELNNGKIKEALRGVSLEIFEGEILALLGINGAGKTTLSSIIASLNPPTFGDILWKHHSIYEDIISYRRIIGFCPQKPNLDKTLTLEENLMFAGRYFGLSETLIKKRKDELVELLDLGNYRKSSVDYLSGGFKQRFLIARTLMHQPKLVILDEPTVGLDAQIRRELWEIILKLKNEKVTVLLTTHYLDEAEALSDRVCLIHEGKIFTVDTPKNLKHRYKKNSLEEVFLQFLDDSQIELLSKGQK